MKYFKFYLLLFVCWMLIIFMHKKLINLRYNSYKSIDYSSECSIMIKSYYIMNGVIYMNEEYAMIRAFSKKNKDIFNDMDGGDRLFKEANSNIIYLIEDFDSTAYSFMKEEN